MLKRFMVFILLSTALAGWVYLNYYWQMHKTIRFSNKPYHKVLGIVDSVPYYQKHHLNFTFHAISIDNNSSQARIKINWYGNSPYLKIGDTWQLFVKLKQASDLPIYKHFNYSKWLEFHNLQAVGTVDSKLNNRKLNTYQGWDPAYYLENLRQTLYQKIRQNLKTTPYTSEIALIGGLTVGIRHDISKKQWSDFQGTGTVHLMAIAGLHIGFLAAFLFFITNWMWSRNASLVLFIPSQKIALIVSLLGSFLYALMAGFALPTQRAFIMIAVFTIAALLNRNISVCRGLFFAFSLILVWDPLAVLSASFWLSFTAVGTIFYGLQARINIRKNYWHQYGLIQWILTLGLMPLTLWFFQLASLSGILANMIAIPIVGFFAVPLCLLGCLVLYVNRYAAQKIFWLAALVLHYLMIFLHGLANLPHAVWHHTFSNCREFLAFTFAIFLILAPRGLAIRWLGFLLAIAVLIF